MAADSKATSITPGQLTTLTQEDKLWRIGKSSIVGGVTGHGGFGLELRESFNGQESNLPLNKNIKDLAPRLHTEVNKIMKKWHTNFIRLSDSDKLELGVLFGGVTDGSAWLLEIDHNGLPQRHENIGFAAIGSGGAFAYHAWATLEHFDVKNRPLTELEAIAYKTVNEAIRGSSIFLGPPVKLWSINQSGARELSKEERKAIENLIDIWKVREVEALAETINNAKAKNL